mgnify:CR=1 FL=1
MTNIAVLGAQYGDEAKGRITLDFSKNFDWVCRFAGGDNVGAMVYRNGKKYVHHLLPVVNYNLSPHTKSFLGNGMVINLESLLEEVKLIENDFPGAAKKLYIDPDAFVVLPEHLQQDQNTKDSEGRNTSTNRGIAQAYTSKVARKGVRVYHYINDNAEIIQALCKFGVKFKNVLQLRPEFEIQNILFEGNQGIMLDLVSGRYPYITSSDTTVSGIYSSGFHFIHLDKVYGVLKPYLTRSGGKELPTEMYGEEAEQLVSAAKEYGNTTGRARGVGYMDLVALKYATLRGGLTHLVLTKLDVLNGQKNHKICISYGKEVSSPNDFFGTNPAYINVPGWNDCKDISQIRPLISVIEKYVGIPVEYVTTGINPGDLICLGQK